MFKTVNEDGECGRVNRLIESFVRIKGYFFRNLGALFIIVFVVLVLTCAFLVVLGDPLVNDVAVSAYCFLVLGVILQALSYVRDKACGSETYERES